MPCAVIMCIRPFADVTGLAGRRKAIHNIILKRRHLVLSGDSWLRATVTWSSFLVFNESSVQFLNTWQTKQERALVQRTGTLMSQVFLTCVKSCLARSTMSLVSLGVISSWFEQHYLAAWRRSSEFLSRERSTSLDEKDRKIFVSST